MSGKGTAEERLDRILLLLPVAVRETEERSGIRLEELARRLDEEVETVLADLSELEERAYYLPAGLGDDLQITLEGDRVRVRTTGAFRRPLRLTGEEAMALGVALRSMAVEPEGDPAGARTLARRLERELVAVGVRGGGETSSVSRGTAGRTGEAGRAGAEAPEESLPGVDADGEDPAGADPLAVERPTGKDARFHAVLERAVREGRVCRLRYLKPGEAEPETRHLAPYRLAYAEGAWYAVGHSRRADAVRVFRLDRMLEVHPTEERFRPPEDFDLEGHLTDGRLYRGQDDREAVVRYSPVVARWIREAWNVEGEEKDGSVRVRHRVADPAWLVAHVLRHGGEAEVLEPPDLRAAVRETAERLARG